MVPLGASGRVGSGSSSSSSSSSGGGGGGSSLLKPNYLSQPPPSSSMPSSMPTMPPRNYDMPNMPNRDFPNMPNMQTAMVSFGQVDRAERKRTADKREGRPETKESREDRKKKRKSRWTDEACKTFIPGLPTMIPAGLSKEQEEAYLLQLKIEEASRRLRSGDLGIPLNPEDRSPSPEPIYSSDGKRLNTREYRKRKELEETRHESIQRMILINPDYKSPPDYKAPQIKVSDKVMIPQDNHPDINFVGLLIGPRGNTLKNMEKETGAKIIIRGKGSVKEGKVGRKDGQPLPGEDEPLHAYVTATDPEAVKRAVNKIKEVIQQGVEVPEGSNELRKMQLRELALLNGTLREDGAPRCTNCGAADHKAWQCQDKANVTNNVMCTACGGVGHISGDCKQKRPGAGFPPFEGGAPGGGGNKIDQEYMSLMAELGEGPPPPAPGGAGPRQSGFAGGNQFERPRAPLAIMGGNGSAPPPPGGPPGGGSGGWGANNWSAPGAKPLMSQPVQPPWGGPPKNGSNGNSSWGNGSYPPPPPPGGAPARPPPPGNMPPWGGPPTSGSGNYPPGFPMGGPPPPPPGGKGSSGSSSSGTPSSGWGMPPWGAAPPPPSGGGSAPGPVPPPPGGRGAPPPMPYWNQGGGWGGGQTNPLSNILGAPPPPPPPS